MEYKPLPIKFRKSPPLSLSVGMTDYITNRAYLTLYGGKTADRYLLSSIAFYSSKDNLGTNPGYATANDIDFDAIAEIPLLLDGKGFVTVPIIAGNNTGASVSVTSTMTVKLRKWDGSTETDLVTEDASISVDCSANQSIGAVYTVDFTVPTTQFKEGDTVRITVETTAPLANYAIVIVHDPKDRDVAISGIPGIATQPDTSVLQALLPIKIDL